MAQKYANVVMTVEIMIPIHEHEAETQSINEHRAKVEVTRAIKDGLWFHVTSPRIVHIAEEK